MNANQKSAINMMLSIMNDGQCAEFGKYSKDSIDYFTTKLKQVTTGKIGHSGNPHGYFIIGLSPSSKRGQENVARQFRFALAKGMTSKAHLACRGLGDVATEVAINNGVFFSYPKQNSKLGDPAMRRVAHGISLDARTGEDVGRKTSALFLALTDADAAEAALAFIRKDASKIRTALNIDHDVWLDQLLESIPQMGEQEVQDETLTQWVSGILAELPEIQPEDERMITESVKRVTAKKKSKPVKKVTLEKTKAA